MAQYKRGLTGFLWFILIVVALSILLGIYSIIIYPEATLSGINGITTVAGLIISVVYAYQLYGLKKHVIIWTHIIFGFSLLGYFVGPINILILIPVVIFGIFWFITYKQLKKIKTGSTGSTAKVQ